MAYFDYTLLPASRTEALGQLLGNTDAGHVHCIYQPFDNQQGDDISDTSCNGKLKCEKCLAYFSSVSRLVQVGTQEQRWICIFCNAYNSYDKEMDGISSSYSVQLHGDDGSEPSTTVIIVDTICDGQELNTLQVGLKKMVLNLTTERYALISLNAAGDVIILSSVRDLHNVKFSIDHFKVEKNLKKLDADYFVKHLLPIKGHIWFDNPQDLVHAIDTLTPSIISVAKKRPKRSTGLALFLATVIDKLEPNSRCHAISFLSGPCTKGSGKVVSRDLKSHLRQQHNLDAGKASYYRDACDFYKALAKSTKITFDFFVSSLDQIGLLEMFPLLASSMGLHQFDSFADLRFTQSVAKYVKLRNSHAIYNPRLKLITSSTLLIDGALADLIKRPPDLVTGEAKPNYSDTPRGVSGTNNWRFRSSCILNPCGLAIPFSFTPSTEAKKSQGEALVPELVFMQFQLQYTKGVAQHVRITTIYLPTTNHLSYTAENSVPRSFQWKISLSYIMRELAYHMTMHNSKITSEFAKQQRKKIDEFAAKINRNAENASEILRALYQLKRTPLLSSANTSPDQRAMFMHALINSSIVGSLRMCCPDILKVKSGKRIPLILSDDCWNEESTMFIDGGFFLGVRYFEEDENLVAAREYACQLLNSPTRFPVPIYIDTKIGGSQDRFLKSRLIPTDNAGSQLLNTQDMSFDAFAKYISKISLAS